MHSLKVDLEVVSYNCCGMKIARQELFYDRLEVEQLLTDNDIVCLQETWLSKYSVTGRGPEMHEQM